MTEIIIDEKYLMLNHNHIFVFGDNWDRKGTGGAAALRHHPNTYGFITKKHPTYKDEDYYRPEDYAYMFIVQLQQLAQEIVDNPEKKYLISKLGAGLANKYKIFEEVIEKGIRCLEAFPNVEFLW
jgi:hypothetical protein